MPQKFISCLRDQALLVPPSLLDWVPEDHVVWTILGAVDELELDAFYGAYRADGRGRPAFEPSMMVALLLYSYARGNRSSRGIERACREDVSYMVVSAMRAPDHSTIAEFRKRHETALGELFTGVLGLCRRAGLVEVGVIAIDGTKISANAAMEANLGYARIAREILEQAAAIDAAEDELYGDARGDELPEQLRTREGRRAAFREAKRQLDAEREGSTEETVGGEPLVALELDRERIMSSEQGRRGWEREGRHKLDELRERQARPIASSRTERLLESKRRLEEEHQVALESNQAYDAFRARGVDRTGRRLHNSSTKPYVPPEVPEGKINTTDHDSRLVATAGHGTIQGYNAQAAVNERQVIVAAEITVTSPDFGHLEPMVDAVLRELAKLGVTDQPGVVVADPGYWHKQQIENIVSQGIQVLIPPDSGLRKASDTRPGWNKGLYAFMRNVLATDLGRAIYLKRQATVEPVFGQLKFNRGINRFQRRGRQAVRSEWRFAAATHNLLKLHTHQAATA
jgi:transposase